MICTFGYQQMIHIFPVVITKLFSLPQKTSENKSLSASKLFQLFFEPQLGSDALNWSRAEI